MLLYCDILKKGKMKIHLVDGTYELFRSFYGAPPKKSPGGREVGATLGLLRSLLTLITSSGATHIACSFDHVIESFRNDLYPGYKTGEGVDAELLSQFPLAEEAVDALGMVIWPMVEFEANDVLASAAIRFQEEGNVDQVVICSPDKDLAQMVSGSRVVCWDRRRDILYDEYAVIEKYNVSPASIPDWLALVGDLPTVILVSLPGELSLPLPCSRNMHTWNRSLQIISSGDCLPVVLFAWQRISEPTRMKRIFSGAWQRFAGMSRSNRTSATLNGEAHTNGSGSCAWS